MRRKKNDLRFEGTYNFFFEESKAKRRIKRASGIKMVGKGGGQQ